MDKKIILAGALSATVASLITVALPETESPTYEQLSSDVVKIQRTVCEPFVYSANTEEIASYITSIQSTIDNNPEMEIPRKQSLERLKSRFIQDLSNVEDNVL